MLDEPTVGLQVTDVAVLASALDAIVDAGNTVLVVEHDPVLLATCDWLIELGPGAGPDGGAIVFEGTPDDARRRPRPQPRRSCSRRSHEQRNALLLGDPSPSLAVARRCRTRGRP